MSRRVLLVLIALLLLVPLVPLAPGQVARAAETLAEEWVARYNGPGNNADYARAMAVGPDGNVYVLSASWGGSSYDYATIKYDRAGNQVWLQRYTGEPSDIAVDASGNVYVTGSGLGISSADYATVKYSAGGVQIWVRLYDGNSGYDHASAIAVDGAGNVYVTGSSQANGEADHTTKMDYATIKYSLDGYQEWVRRYDGVQNGSDWAEAIALDSGGSVYVTGASRTGATDDYVTIKYDSNGNQIWLDTYGNVGGLEGIDRPYALALDASGNLYVTGSSTGYQTSFFEYATVKYNGNGARVWVARYNAPGDGDDFATALAVGPGGTVYVTGGSSRTTSPGYSTVKYDASGNQIWDRRYDGPGSGADFARAIAVDNAGNAYVTGESYGTGTFEDYATVKYDAAGNEAWVLRYGGPSSDHAVAVAVDDLGNVYVAGESYDSNGNYDLVTIKYAPNDAPVAADDAYATSEGTALNVSAPGVLANDSDPDDNPLTAALSMPPTHGDVTLNADGSFSYTPAAGYYGLDSFTYQANDGGSNSNLATVAITVYPPPPDLGEAWVARYNGSGNNADYAAALAVDAAGNTYVTGNTVDVGGNRDYATIKYDPSGNQVWLATYNGLAGADDYGRAIAVDAAGNVYVTGYSAGTGTGYDYATVKYGPDGSRLWVARFTRAAMGEDKPAAIAVDGNGNVYVTGRSRTDGSYYDYVTVKYDAGGNQVWAKDYNGPANNWDEATAMALDASGHLYVTGRSYTGFGVGADDFTTIMYDASTGGQVWVARYNGPANLDDRPTALAVDEAGNVYVTGGTEGGTSYEDYATVKYDSSGTQQWAATYDGGAYYYDRANALAVDGAGNVYVTGRVYTYSQGNNYATLKYDAAGNRLWVKHYDAGNSDEAVAIGLDGLGNVYVAGTSRSSSNGDDYTTVRYDAVTGNQTWLAHYNSNVNLADQATAMAVDGSGNVFVTGSSNGGVAPDWATVKYSAATPLTSPTPQWAARYDGPAHGFDGPAAMTVDGLGNVYVTGQSLGGATQSDYITAKYDSAGNRAWAVRYNNGPVNGEDVPVAMAVDGAGNVYVTGWSYYGVNTGQDYATVKYDADGNQVWAARYNGTANLDDLPVALAVDAVGNVYVTGHSLGSATAWDYATTKYDASGNLLWVSHYNGPGNSNDQATGVALDASGNVYVTGWSVGSGTGTDYATIKYDTNGNLAWERRYNGPANYDEDPVALEVDAAGNVYLTGKSWGGDPSAGGSSSDYATLKYDTEGNQLWVARYGAGSYDAAVAMALDADDNVYVTGTSGDDYATVKYTPEGTETWVARFDGHYGADYVEALAVKGGNVYVAGWSYGYSGNYNLVTIVYDANGDRTWQATWSGPGSFSHDEARAVAVDRYGNVHVAGVTYAEGPTNADMVTLKYAAPAPLPMELWVARYNGPASLTDEARAVAVDGAGNVYVTGATYGYSGYWDITTVKYDAAGNRLWAEQYDGSGGNDEATAIAVDAAGHAYVAGRSYWEGHSQYVTIKYGPNGGYEWIRYYTGTPDGFDIARAIAVDGTGNVYVTGGSIASGGADDYATIKYDASGQELWVRRYNGLGDGGDWATALALDGAGNVYVTGSSARGPLENPNYDYVTLKYDANGNQVWAARYDGLGGQYASGDGPVAVAVDRAGDVLVTGWSVGPDSSTDYATIKYDARGNQVWVNRYAGLRSGGNAEAKAMALDGSGNVYVTGWSSTEARGDYVSIKYDADGEQMWLSSYDGPGNGDDVAQSIGLDGERNLYVTGGSWGTMHDYATIRYDTNTGRRLWVARYDGPAHDLDNATAMAVDTAGNVYVTGTSWTGDTQFDFATVKYGAAVLPPAPTPTGPQLGRLSLTVDEATTGPGAREIPISNIPIEAVPGLSSLVAAAPLSSITIAGSPLSSIPLSSIPLSSITVSGVPLSSIPLSSIPLSSIGGWEGVLKGSALEGIPLQSITLQEVLALQPRPAPLSSITLADADLSGTPLSSIGLAPLALGSLPLSSIPLSSIGSDWDRVLASLGYTWQSLGTDINSATVLGLQLKGVPLSSIPLSSIPLSSIPLSSITLGTAPLSSIPLSSIPLSSIPLSSIPLSSIPLSSIAVAGAPLSSIPLSSISPDGGTLESYLAGYPGFTYPDLSLTSTSTLQDLVLAIFNKGYTLESSPLSSIPLSSIPLSSIPLSSIPLSSIPLSSIPLSSIPLSSITIAGTPLSSIPLSSISPNGQTLEAYLSSFPGFTYADLGLTSTSTLSQLFAAILARNVPLESSPLSSIPLSSIPLSSIPLSSIPLSSIPLSSIPLSSIPLSSIPLSSIAVAGAPLSSIPLSSISPNGQTLETYLSGFPGFTYLDLGLTSSSTLRQLVQAILDGGITLSASPLSSIPLSSIPLSSIPLSSIPLSSIPLSSIAIGGTPLSSIPLSSIPLSSIPLSSIPLSSIPLSSIRTDSSPLSSIPLSSIPLSSIDWTKADETWTLGQAADAGAILPGATLGQISGALGGFVLGDLRVYGTATVQDIVAALGGNAADVSYFLSFVYGGGTLGEAGDTGVTLGNLTFGDLLIAMLMLSDFPWEKLPLDEMGVQRIAGADPLHYHLSFANTGGTPVASPVLTAQLPQGFVYVPGSSALAVLPGAPAPVPDPVVSGSSLTWSLNTFIPPGPEVRLDFQAWPGLGLGTFATSVGVRSGALTTSLAGQAPLAVTEPFEPDSNVPASAPLVNPDVLYVSYISSGQDTDYFRIPVPADPGARINVYLSHLTNDDDLVIYRPQTAPLSSVPLSSIPLSSIPLEDQGLQADNTSRALPPETLQDIALASLPLSSISANRADNDESVETTSKGETGYYTIQVSGYNGSFSDQPYVLRVKVTPPPAAPKCAPRPFPFAGQGIPGTLPSALSADVNTLFLVNLEQLGNLYGAQAAGDVKAGLDTLAQSLDVKGAVIPVEGNAQVRAAYASWDQTPCSPVAANNVVSAITSVVQGLRVDPATGNVALPNLRYVVIVGSDEVVPMARVPDLTRISNQSDYAGNVAFGGSNALSGAFVTSNLLSDDVYGDFNPVPWLGRQLFVPDVAVGRLVETPGEIVTAIQRFLASGGGLDPRTAFVTGYDFLADGARSVQEALAAELGATVDSLINETWTAQQLVARLLDPTSGAPDIASLNAHYDHFRALPADQNAGGTETDLFTSQDVAAFGAGRLLGRILFTMGCNAGVSVADVLVGSPTTDQARRLLDWPQVYSQQGALYVGNAGFGYGDTESVALSERLMVLFAQRLDGSMTVGQALAFAKQEYFASLGVYGVYDEKAMAEATFYGLPMYRIGTQGRAPTTPAAPLAKAVVDSTGLEAAAIHTTPAFQLVTGQTGSYYQIEGQAQVTHYRPIQPLTSFDVTQPGTKAHGALITSLATSDQVGFDAAFARPVVDLQANEPPVEFGDVAFPTSFQSIATYNTPEGERQRLVLIPGQFFRDATGQGVQRLLKSVDLQVYYSNSGDYVPPTLPRTEAAIIGSSVTFNVVALPGDIVRRVLVLYRDSTGVWQTLDLTQEPTGNLWTGSAPVTGDQTHIEYFVQAVDASGNVAVSSKKGDYFEAIPLPPPVAEAAGPYTALEGSSLTLDGYGSTISQGAIVRYEWDLDNDGYYDDATGIIVTTTFADRGAFTVGLRVTDQYGRSSADSARAVIENVPTPPSVDAGAGGSLDEGNLFTGAGSFTDPEAGAWTATVDYGDGAGLLPLPMTGQTFTLSHLYQDNGRYTVTVRVKDDDGDAGDDTLVVTVRNLAPSLGAITAPSDPVLAGTTVSASATFTDPGTRDAHTAQWDWGDGSGLQAGSVSEADGTAAGSHAYTAAGVYTVTLALSDDDGGSAQAAYRYVVVYNPDAGSIAGGGGFESPAGAYAADPAAAGRATFGIVARYQNGAATPSGATQFRVNQADLSFASTSYQWLVVNGARAQLKGAGTINRAGSYGFLITVVDASVSGGGADMVRFKIWDIATGQVLYDTQPGAPDNADPTTPVTGGSVVVQN